MCGFNRKRVHGWCHNRGLCGDDLIKFANRRFDRRTYYGTEREDQHAGVTIRTLCPCIDSTRLIMSQAIAPSQPGRLPRALERHLAQREPTENRLHAVVHDNSSNLPLLCLTFDCKSDPQDWRTRLRSRKRFSVPTRIEVPNHNAQP